MFLKPQHEVAHIIQDKWENIIKDNHFNSHQIRMLHALRVCRTSNLGWHLDQCDHCNHLTISYNSCRNRHCPKCQGACREDWISAQHDKLLPVKYFHVVFTMPDSLNKLCLYQPKMMYSLLFKAAWYTINTFAKDHKHLGAQTGMTTILHTWGQNMSLHPHLHCIIPAGGITKYGKWKHAKSKGKYLFPVKSMSPVFRACFVRLLRKNAGDRKINIEQNLFDQLFKNKWVVFAKQPFLGPDQIIEYIGRYTHKIAISNHRILGVDENKVVFRYKNYRKAGKNEKISLDKMAFVKRFSLHILPLRFVRIRHFGILNARSKFKRIDIMKAITQRALPDQKSMAIADTFSKQIIPNPLCPVCKKGRMHTIAVSNGRDPPPVTIELLSKEPS